VLTEIQKAYGENATAFKLKDEFTSIVFSWDEEYNCPRGRVWLFDKKGQPTIIFDQFVNGYKGVLRLNQLDNSSSTRSINLIDGDNIVIAFQYSGDEQEFANSGPSKHPADYFDWIIIYKYSSNTLQEILNYECA
jgi:hypothetical protein